MQNFNDPSKVRVEPPGDLITLTDYMDDLVNKFQKVPLSSSDRRLLSENYEAAATKYNQMAGRNLYLTKITSVISSMNYAAKKGDTLK